MQDVSTFAVFETTMPINAACDYWNRASKGNLDTLTKLMDDSEMS